MRFGMKLDLSVYSAFRILSLVVGAASLAYAFLGRIPTSEAVISAVLGVLLLVQGLSGT
jgi:hypothetical protein